MIYKEFHDQKISQLGFGCMRFATNPDTGEIDQEKVNAMFDLAIQGGVNYFDTAYPYLGGKSEGAMAKALSKYPRSSYFLADKFPGHSLTQPIDNHRLFQISLKRCGTDYFDFYLLHNVTEWSVKFYESQEYHILEDILEEKRAGRIRHLGFSFHGGPQLLEDFLLRHEGEFDFVQIQLNYLDWTLQDAKTKYETIVSHGLGVWVMEPCRGGKLSLLPEKESEKLKALQAAGEPFPSDASYAFRFLQGLSGVKVILSGMNEVVQVEDNLRTFEREWPLTEPEKKTLMEIAEGLKQGVPCTGCRYCCDTCPMGLDIPYLLQCYNDIKYAQSMTPSVRIDALKEEKRPSACVRCGRCTHACPQHINVPKALAELSEIYEKGPHWGDVVRKRESSLQEDLRKG